MEIIFRGKTINNCIVLRCNKCFSHTSLEDILFFRFIDSTFHLFLIAHFPLFLSCLSDFVGKINSCRIIVGSLSKQKQPEKLFLSER